MKKRNFHFSEYGGSGYELPAQIYGGEGSPLAGFEQGMGFFEVDVKRTNQTPEVFDTLKKIQGSPGDKSGCSGLIGAVLGGLVGIMLPGLGAALGPAMAGLSAAAGDAIGKAMCNLLNSPQGRKQLEHNTKACLSAFMPDRDLIFGIGKVPESVDPYRAEISREEATVPSNILFGSLLSKKYDMMKDPATWPWVAPGSEEAKAIKGAFAKIFVERYVLNQQYKDAIQRAVQEAINICASAASGGGENATLQNRIAALQIRAKEAHSRADREADQLKSSFSSRIATAAGAHNATPNRIMEAANYQASRFYGNEYPHYRHKSQRPESQVKRYVGGAALLDDMIRCVEKQVMRDAIKENPKAMSEAIAQNPALATYTAQLGVKKGSKVGVGLAAGGLVGLAALALANR